MAQRWNVGDRVRVAPDDDCGFAGEPGTVTHRFTEGVSARLDNLPRMVMHFLDEELEPLAEPTPPGEG